MTDGLTIGAIEAAAPIDFGGAAGRASPAAPLPAATPAGTPNPTLQLDPALGLVVMQFRDGDHGGATSIPTQQQLEAYRDGSAALPKHREARTA